MYLGYNSELKRFGILDQDLWIKEALYSEDDIQVLLDEKWVDTWIKTDKTITHSNGYCLSDFPDIALDMLPCRIGE